MPFVVNLIRSQQFTCRNDCAVLQIASGVLLYCLVLLRYLYIVLTSYLNREQGVCIQSLHIKDADSWLNFAPTHPHGKGKECIPPFSRVVNLPRLCQTYIWNFSPLSQVFNLLYTAIAWCAQAIHCVIASCLSG